MHKHLFNLVSGIKGSGLEVKYQLSGGRQHTYLLTLKLLDTYETLTWPSIKSLLLIFKHTYDRCCGNKWNNSCETPSKAFESEMLLNCGVGEDS